MCTVFSLQNDTAKLAFKLIQSQQCFYNAYCCNVKNRSLIVQNNFTLTLI